jgi:hypothetical protein
MQKIVFTGRLMDEWARRKLIETISVEEPHHFNAAPAPGKNFDAAPAPAPTLLYI